MNFIQTDLQKDILRTAIKVVLIVGTILNLINQGPTIAAGEWENINWIILLTTYSVPYMVSTYSAVMARMKSN